VIGKRKCLGTGCDWYSPLVSLVLSARAAVYRPKPRGGGAQCTGQAAVAEPSVQAKPRCGGAQCTGQAAVAEPSVPAQAAVAEPSVQAKPRWRSPVYRPSRGGGAQCTGQAAVTEPSVQATLGSERIFIEVYSRVQACNNLFDWCGIGTNNLVILGRLRIHRSRRILRSC